MVRVIIKGGVWRNTEDEVLKAAVMKYGKNQWSRVASLLHRKSAKQCKARWFEWLDPSIKKTDWSRDEDEKLLHLAKLMPTQWRTIAPIVGRTASQCLERYEHLLDQAVAKAEGSSITTDDARRIRPGEIDPCPENKPARPDPIDMDEDELEMLSEARARLANTQGKKAKRKARERQLDEARRLAWLQKRRELRAAGIAWGRRGYSKRGTDYNEATPFMRQPPLGFHNPAEDCASDDVNSRHVSQKILSQRKGNEAATMENKKKSKERMKRRNEGVMSDATFARLHLDKKRNKLVLPEPQISDAELDSIVKVGRTTDVVREVAASNDDAVTSALLPEFGASIRSDSLRTPLLADVGRDTVMSEAENLRKLQNLQTPLMGGVNPELTESDFSSALPRREPLQTPNTALKSALTPYTAGRTPAPNEQTPSIRSAFTIGTPASDSDFGLNRNTSSLFNVSREKLRNRFMSLPMPKNDFELVPPQELEMTNVNVESDDGSENPQKGTYKVIPDAEDVQTLQREEEERKCLLIEQSEAVKRQLPRPYDINTSILGADEASLSEFDAAQELIKKEVLILLHRDMLEFPSATQIKYMEATNGRDRAVEFLKNNPCEQFTVEEIESAKRLLEAEAEKLLAECEDYDRAPEQFSNVWEDCLSQIFYLPVSKRYSSVKVTSKRDRLDSCRHELQQNRDAITKMGTRATKVERKFRTLVAGHLAHTNSALEQLADLTNKLDLAEIQKSSYEMLLSQEQQGIEHRKMMLTKDVRFLEIREGDLQLKYRNLQNRLNELTIRKQRKFASIVANPVAYDNEFMT